MKRFLYKTCVRTEERFFLITKGTNFVCTLISNRKSLELSLFCQKTSENPMSATVCLHHISQSYTPRQSLIAIRANDLPNVFFVLRSSCVYEYRAQH